LSPRHYNNLTKLNDRTVALWMGVPVLTMAGEQLCGRMGVSLLSALDLPGWVAEDEDDYVDRACSLAADPRD